MSKPPKPWVESMLVAYVDRQLDAAQMAVVDDIVRQDPEARTIVSVLRGSAEALSVAFNRPLHEAVPARLLAAVGGDGNGGASANVIPVRRPVRPVPLQHLLSAVAASIAILFVGIGIGYLQFAPAATIRPTGQSSGFEAALYRALERDRFGIGVSYGDAAAGVSGAVTVVGKVDSSLGDACREFRHDWTEARGKGVETGLACRSATGDWSVLTVPHGPTG
jgi:surface antigen